MNCVYLFWIALVAAWYCMLSHPAADAAGTLSLEEQLRQADLAELSAAASSQGDAQRGALLFHQPHLTCTQCHPVDQAAPFLGPDLASMGSDAAREDRGRDVTASYLVESLLDPAKSVRANYRGVLVVTDEGVTHSGILHHETPTQIELRDATQNGQLISIAKDTIDQRKDGLSIMPTGLVNQLADRQQFLDLVRYLIEIGAGGDKRARELQPPDALIQLPPLPAYEKEVDHAGIIADWNDESLQRGALIYGRICANCHGTLTAPGSMPTSLRFASGKFNNGSDPYRIYQTLTHGHGRMVAQRWMVPQQKYDVIHYLRETFLRDHNPSQFVRVDSEYLDRLPPGTTRGPEPLLLEPWAIMNYGPTLTATYEVALNNSGDRVGRNLGPEATGDAFLCGPLTEAERARHFAYKGIAVRLDVGPGGIARGRQWMAFDHDTLRIAAVWNGAGFIDFNSIHFNGTHGVHPRLVGEIDLDNSEGPGWANPQTGEFDDPRPLGRDGRPYGPLPRSWARYRGMYHHGCKAVFSYTVGDAAILELPGSEDLPDCAALVFTRTLTIGRSSKDLRFRVAPADLSVAVSGTDSLRLKRIGGTTIAELPAEKTPQTFKLLVADLEQDALDAVVKSTAPPASLQKLTKGGLPRWPEIITTEPTYGADRGPFAVDLLTVPASNPWNCRVRPTGFDFLDSDSAAVCSWDGDVWLVRGLGQHRDLLSWQRIASGLFQPLGLKIVEGAIYVTCRDQLVVLRDLNGDGETDFYECFNNDHQVTEHFHEFAMGLQTDSEGRFYYAKSARHAKTAVVPHHGTLLRVACDGSSTEILATGFRAANGVCLNPDGTFLVTDQEGHWNPKNRINWVVPGGFYGNMYGYHDVTDASDQAMQQPLCWITNAFDRSPAELLWTPKDAWGPLGGALLSSSYGYGKIYVVSHEKTDAGMQGGMCELPLPTFPTGIMRGRFHPQDRQLYVCGMFAWGADPQEPGGFYRVRYTGQPVCIPLEMHANRSELTIAFSGELDRTTAIDAKSYDVKSWSLRRTANYGSDHYSEQHLAVDAVQISADGRTVRLAVPKLEPTWCMEIQYHLQDAGGNRVDGKIHNTIHQLGS